MTAPPLTLNLNGQIVPYYPLVLKVAGEVHLLAMHKAEHWGVYNPWTGDLILTIKGCLSRGQLTASALHCARTRARRELAARIRKMGSAAFNESLKAPA